MEEIDKSGGGTLLVVAMALLCSDEERLKGKGTWTLRNPVPSEGYENVLIEKFVIEGGIVQTFARDPRKNEGHRIVHSQFMVHLTMSVGPIEVWESYQRNDDNDARERCRSVVDIVGQKWEEGKPIPSLEGQPSGALIKRMFVTSDCVRIYALPDDVEPWKTMREQIKKPFGIMFSLMSVATRVIDATSDLYVQNNEVIGPYADIQREVFERAEMLRLGEEEEEEEEDDEEEEDEEDDDAIVETSPLPPASPPPPAPLPESASAPAPSALANGQMNPPMPQG
jgi:hypothetical protein